MFQVKSKKDIIDFAETVKIDLPDKQIFKEMGAGNVNVEELYQILRKAFLHAQWFRL